jgi:hypothetical protein
MLIPTASRLFMFEWMSMGLTRQLGHEEEVHAIFSFPLQVTSSELTHREVQ